MKGFHLAAASVLAMTLAGTALAQSGDVVIMRKTMKPIAGGVSVPVTPAPTPAPVPTPTPAPSAPADWVVGEWSFSDGQASCTAVAAQRRSVTCMSQGREVSVARCSGSAPSSERTVPRLESCGYVASGWTPYVFSSTCSADATKTRSADCLRSDGVKVVSTECTSRGIAVSETVSEANYASCSYQWETSAWSAPSTTCGKASFSREVSCRSSDGRTVEDGMCAGVRPDTQKVEEVLSGCGYSWGQDDWGAVVPACGQSTQTRSVFCLRSDGVKAEDARCSASGDRPAETRPATDYSACTYAWSTTSWGEWSATCGSATRIRDVTCQSSDGRTVEDARCSGAKPDTSQTQYQTQGCGHAWVAGEWSVPDRNCSEQAQQTRSVSCVRSDGQTVDEANCTAARPEATKVVADYSGCTPFWYTAADPSWSDWSSHCSSNATRTRRISCYRTESKCIVTSPGVEKVWWGGDYCDRVLDPSVCNAYPGATSQGYSPASGTETAAVYDQCSYEWRPGEWGEPIPFECGLANRFRIVPCYRSDGTNVDHPFCTQTRPSEMEQVRDYSMCKFSRSWQASELYHSVGSAGGGGTWTAKPGDPVTAVDTRISPTAGALSYGPYVAGIPAGSYTAYFVIKVEGAAAGSTVGYVDVNDADVGLAYSIKGSRTLKASDWSVQGQYMLIEVPFVWDASQVGHRIEFRTFFFDNSKMTIQRAGIK